MLTATRVVRPLAPRVIDVMQQLRDGEAWLSILESFKKLNPMSLEESKCYTITVR